MGSVVFAITAVLRSLPSVSPEPGWIPPPADGFSTRQRKSVTELEKKEGRQKETVINKPASVATGLWSCFCLCIFLLVPEGAGADKAAAGRG